MDTVGSLVDAVPNVLSQSSSLVCIWHPKVMNKLLETFTWVRDSKTYLLMAKQAVNRRDCPERGHLVLLKQGTGSGGELWLGARG